MVTTIGCDSQKPNPIKVGVIVPITETKSNEGELIAEGIRLSHYLEPEVLKRPVELIIVDSKNDQKEATKAAKKMIEKDKVVAIIGSWNPDKGITNNTSIPIINLALIRQPTALNMNTALDDQQHIIAREYKKKYQNKNDIPALTVLGYDSYRLLLTAIDDANDDKPRHIKKALHKITNFNGVDHVYIIDKTGNLDTTNNAKESETN